MSRITTSIGKTPKYPINPVYQNTYWATGCFTTNYMRRNREDIRLVLNLKKYLHSSRPGRNYELYDHCESYQCKDGTYVLITSPYGKRPQLLELGFHQIIPIYCTEATSYVRTFPSKKALDNFIFGKGVKGEYKIW